MTSCAGLVPFPAAAAGTLPAAVSRSCAATLFIAAAADAAGVMELKVVSDFIPAGDHEVVICDVVAWKTPEAAAGDAWPTRKQAPLYTGLLRREGYL